jgi:GNAT superfamily N-acetyltransferase
VSGFEARKVDLFRPYPDEVPWQLLGQTGIDDDTLSELLSLDFVRVAKHQGRVVGAYGLRPLDPTRYELVTLVVEPAYRRQGLGRWLAGHAIGLAETKGGREILARPGPGPSRRFLEQLDFQPDGDALLLTLTPE